MAGHLRYAEGLSGAKAQGVAPVDSLLTQREIDQKLIDLVARARQQYQIPTGCSGEDACQKVGLQLRRGVMSDGTDGAWSESEGCILLNQMVDWPPRVQFTIFHEIVHFLLDDDGELIDFFTNALRKDKRAYESAIERCCHQGAAEFLIPREWVREAIAGAGLSVELVEQLAERSGASIVAAAIQLAACAPVDCYVLLCCFGPIPKAWPPRSGLHIEYAAASSRVKYPIARFIVVPSDHLLTVAWRTRSYVNDRSYVPFRYRRGMPCNCEAKYFNGRIIGVLTLSPSTPKEQLALF